MSETKHEKRKRVESVGRSGDEGHEAIADLLLTVRFGRELVKQVLRLSDSGELGSGRLAQMKMAARRFQESDLFPENYTEYFDVQKS